MGSQGLTQLPAGFSNVAWQERGLWSNLESTPFYDDVLSDSMTLIQYEVATAKYGKQRGTEWIVAHPGKAIILAPLKIWQELRPRAPTEFVMFVLFVFGIFVAARDRLAGKGTDRTGRELLILLGLYFSNLFAIACTWSVGGRFLVPLLFVQYVFIAQAVAVLCNRGSTEPQQ